MRVCVFCVCACPWVCFLCMCMPVCVFSVYVHARVCVLVFLSVGVCVVTPLSGMGFRVGTNPLRVNGNSS